jgi:phosphoserine phosphatase RsbU/P
MNLLIAEDDPVSQRLLEATLRGWGYEPIVASDGLQAWEALQQADGPCLAILDWMMPEMDGVEVCRKVRDSAAALTFILLVTARGEKGDIVAGLEAGANDYLTKPFDREELRARLNVGVRVLELQKALSDRVRQLEAALAEVRQLQGILPICCYCKNIRKDAQYWQRVEDYIAEQAGVGFSHGICPECWETVVNPQLEETIGCRLPYDG